MQMLVVGGCFHKQAFKQSILPKRVFNNGVLRWPAVCQTSPSVCCNKLFLFGDRPGKLGCALPLYLA